MINKNRGVSARNGADLLNRNTLGIEELVTPIKKRGRPKKDGFQPLCMLERSALVFYAYDRSREEGAKHFVGLEAAVTFIRESYPATPISQTEVRRTLAAWRPRKSKFGLFVVRPDPSDAILTLPNGRKVRKLYTAFLRPRPNYPRINAAEKR